MIASANADMLFHYWKVGHFILYLQKKEGWGSKVIDNLSKAIRSKYPDKKGYSRRNIFYMCQFASAYPLEVLKEMDRIDSLLTTPTVEKVLSLTNELNQIVQQPVVLIQATENQSNTITQQPVAQLEEVTETSTPVVKGTSGILFLSKDIDSVKRENCISCGYCVDVCPMGLMPMKFAESYRKEQYEKLVTVYHLDNCIECGACEYVCPSRVPLIKSIKEGKEKLRETGEMK